MDYLKDGNDYFCSKERKLTLKQGQWLAKWDQLSQDWVLGQSVSVLSQVPVSAPHFPPQWLVAIITGDIQNSSHLGALNLHLPRACSVLTQRAGRGRSEDFGKGVVPGLGHKCQGQGCSLWTNCSLSCLSLHLLSVPQNMNSWVCCLGQAVSFLQHWTMVLGMFAAGSGVKGRTQDLGRTLYCHVLLCDIGRWPYSECQSLPL